MRSADGVAPDVAPTDTSSPTLLGLVRAHRRAFAPVLTFAFGRIVTIAPLVLHQWLSVRGAKRLGLCRRRGTIARSRSSRQQPRRSGKERA